MIEEFLIWLEQNTPFSHAIAFYIISQLFLLGAIIYCNYLLDRSWKRTWGSKEYKKYFG